MTTLKEIIYYPSESKMDTLNMLIENKQISPEEIVEEVILLGKARTVYLVSRFVNIGERLIGRLAHEICKLRDVEYIYKFALDVKGAPIDELTRGITATKNLNYILKFAENVHGADLKRIGNTIKKMRDPYYIMEFVSKIKPDCALEFVDTIIEIGNPLYIYEFAIYIPGAPIPRLAEAMKKTNEARDIFYFVRDLKEQIPISTIKDLMRRVIELKESEWIYIMTLIPGLPIGDEGVPVIELANGLLASKPDPIFYELNLYLFARDFVNRGAPVDKLIKRLQELCSFDNIYKVIVDVPRVDQIGLMDWLISTSSKSASAVYLMNLVLEDREFSLEAAKRLVNRGDNVLLNSVLRRLETDNMDLFILLTQSSLTLDMGDSPVR